MTHQPTKDIPVDPKGQEMAVGEYTGQTEQTTSNKNAVYWDCIKSKIGEFKKEKEAPIELKDKKESIGKEEGEGNYMVRNLKRIP